MRVSPFQKELLHRCLVSGLDAGLFLGARSRWERRAGCRYPTARSRQRLGHEEAKEQGRVTTGWAEGGENRASRILLTRMKEANAASLPISTLNGNAPSQVGSALAQMLFTGFDIACRRIKQDVEGGVAPQLGAITTSVRCRRPLGPGRNG